MKQALTAKRTVFIHDLDGVHYPYHLFGDITDFCGDIKATVAPLLLEGLDAVEAKKLGRNSYLTTGDGLHVFVEMARERGLNADDFRETIHRDYHVLQLTKVRELYPHVLGRSEKTVGLFESLRPHVRHGMITQSCRETWAAPVLTDLGHIGFFDQPSIFGFREFGWHKKAESTEPLRRIVNHMGAQPDQCIFIEDNLDNLKKAKEFSGDLLTVFLCHNKPRTPVPDFVDIQTENLSSLFDMAARVHCVPRLQTRPKPAALILS